MAESENDSAAVSLEGSVTVLEGTDLTMPVVDPSEWSATR